MAWQPCMYVSLASGCAIPHSTLPFLPAQFIDCVCVGGEYRTTYGRGKTMQATAPPYLPATLMLRRRRLGWFWDPALPFPVTYLPTTFLCACSRYPTCLCTVTPLFPTPITPIVTVMPVGLYPTFCSVPSLCIHCLTGPVPCSATAHHLPAYPYRFLPYLFLPAHPLPHLPTCPPYTDPPPHPAFGGGRCLPARLGPHPLTLPPFPLEWELPPAIVPLPDLLPTRCITYRHDLPAYLPGDGDSPSHWVMPSCPQGGGGDSHAC